MKQQLVREMVGGEWREAIAEAATLAAKALARQATSRAGRSPATSEQETRI